MVIKAGLWQRIEAYDDSFGILTFEELAIDYKIVTVIHQVALG
jgi:hypothetical protein